jgi:hypothetical protein
MKYADKMKLPIEATHPHKPPVSWCRKCNPSYKSPELPEEEETHAEEDNAATTAVGKTASGA